MTDIWDPSNPEHKAIAHGIEVSVVYLCFRQRWHTDIYRLETVLPRCAPSTRLARP